MTEGNRQREQESKRAQYRPPRARYLKQDAALKANLVAPRCLIERTGRCGAKLPEPWHRSTPKRGLNEDAHSRSTRAALAPRCGLGRESALAKSGFAHRFPISPIDRRAASAAPMGQSESRPSPVEGYPQSGCHLDASFPRTQHADGGASIVPFPVLCYPKAYPTMWAILGRHSPDQRALAWGQTLPSNVWVSRWGARSK